MLFQLTEEQMMIRQAARDFAKNECLPGVIERDEKQQFPREQIMKLADLESAYILTPPELVEFINNSVEMGAKAQETLARIYDFLETFKAQFSN